MIDKGHGPAVVMVPGIQGRWEWMSPAVEALATRCRVVTGSLANDQGSQLAIDPLSGFESYVEWVDDLLDRAGLDDAAVCGVSYGGLVALHYAAKRPERVRSLILVSTPSPSWEPNCRVEWYLRFPRLMSPIFALSSPFRLYPEIARALPHPVTLGSFAVRHLHRVIRYPPAPTEMAQRIRLLKGIDFADDCRRIKMPTLVVTGIADLDRVVPVSSTREYLDAIHGSRYIQMADTGHIGLVTKPHRFSTVVADFVAAQDENQNRPMQVSA